MILFVIALQAEAKPLIAHFGLRKDMAVSVFPLYRHEQVALIVSGVGKVRSAMAALYLLTRYETEQAGALLVNIGCCGAADPNNPPGTLLWINKVTDAATGRDTYPDLPGQPDCRQAAVVCYDRPVPGDQVGLPAGSVCDMESAGIMAAAARLIGPHQILLLKIVSDLLEPGSVSPDQLSALIAGSLPRIEALISQTAESISLPKADLTAVNAARDRLSAALRLTAAMKRQLDQDIRRALAQSLDVLPILEQAGAEAERTLPERRLAFAAIRKKLARESV
jgi:nucleoside phosphorylase